MARQGNIKISGEQMMPIIKKWLYSDKDIFLREIVANATDAITKLKKLIAAGEAEEGTEPFRITVTADEKAGTLTVEDNGIGMTEDEVERYITEVAFSGAAEFLEKYEKAGGDGIIGHFGLGFYSAYMVSNNIEIFTKSFTGAPAVHWQSDGESVYTIEPCEKEGRGTKVVMHLAEEEKEFCKEFTLRTLLRKYCSFMPYEIYLNPKGGKDEKPVNTVEPLYLKDPKECTEEEYKAFYRETFSDFQDPLFWIHLNMDYPFRVKGILYFPKVRRRVELECGQVKLYCNRVFIADNIKEVIPEFLMLLNGVIDSPDIPLNISRSFLQNDRQVQKIAGHITKKVADKLNELYQTDKERYEKSWNDLSTFVKFGCIKDDKFYERVKDIVLFRDLKGNLRPIESFFGAELSDEEAKEGKEPEPCYYVSDENKQARYIKMFEEAGLDAAVCDGYVDPHFISYLEYKNPRRVRFLRIDADVAGALKAKEGAEGGAQIQAIFEKALEGTKVKVRAETLKSGETAIVTVPEFSRRMGELNSFYSIPDGGEEDVTLIVNLSSPCVAALKDAEEERSTLVARQIYFSALSSLRRLKPDELEKFSAAEAEIMRNYLEKK